MAERTPEPNVRDDGSIPAGRQATETAVAHERMRRAILRGELAAGEVLKQGQLMERFGVGRTPLRESLRLLEREGLVEAEPQRRARVAEFSVEDLEQLYAMRIELEALAIRHSVPSLSESELRTLDEDLARMEEFAKVEDYWGWEVPHRAFHFGLVAHAGERLFRTIRQLSDHAERYRHFYTVESPRAWTKGIAEHRAILDAALSRDAVAAAERLARHYSTVVLSSIAMLAPEYEPTLVRTALRGVTATGARPERSSA